MDSVFFRSGTRTQEIRDIASRHIAARENLCKAFGHRSVLSDPIWEAILEIFACGPVASAEDLHARLDGSVQVSNCRRILQYCVSEGHLFEAGGTFDVSNRSGDAVEHYLREICGSPRSDA